MEPTNEDLLGSLDQQRSLQINCQQGVTINLCVIDAKKENIENLIMECNNYLKTNQL